MAASPVIFVFENSHFGHLKTCRSAPLTADSRVASSIRARHMAQRGGLMVARGRAAGVSDGGMAYPGEGRVRFGGPRLFLAGALQCRVYTLTSQFAEKLLHTPRTSRRQFSPASTRNEKDRPKTVSAFFDPD
ncbi:MAG: hypothetical protein V4517_18990 [Pseudomonadota bacterium]